MLLIEMEMSKLLGICCLQMIVCLVNRFLRSMYLGFLSDFSKCHNQMT